ncbi:Fe3+-hydroxamate ABC transporter substrate-binding protein [Veronia nyctiphanis]|uniref:Fe3+-hydroxamate ABC transporter substrate-binding protein n=1 Tax=Veronia nyctiphanis TaxID=1278244 RepID=A0A4Q0YWF4_9GAMM|nr:TIGR04219 family outer membrane beta-barrel protein [Veronia nyctiphanis]RXJ73351.1 Fe3+-hydroxamate ABC transporter substrate-binding protein [Veronia nyctiphanis]
MKKTTLSVAALAVAGLLSMPAQADMLLGGKVGYDAWFAKSDVNSNKDEDSTLHNSFTASLEHFIPLVPNVKVRYTAVEADKKTNNEKVSFDQMDATLYYEILDNDLVSIDAGLTLHKFGGGDFLNQKIDNFQPAIYGDVRVGIPATPFFIFATGNVGEFKDSKTFDAEAGAIYSLGLVAADINLKAGYRTIDHDLEIGDVSTLKYQQSGLFAGVEIDF